MPTSEEQLQAKREEIARLREQVTLAKAENARKVEEAENDAVMAQLDAEAKSLQAQLASLTGTDLPDAGPEVVVDENGEPVVTPEEVPAPDAGAKHAEETPVSPAASIGSFGSISKSATPTTEEAGN